MLFESVFSEQMKRDGIVVQLFLLELYRCLLDQSPFLLHCREKGIFIKDKT